MRTIISCLALGIFTVVSSQRVVADDPVLDCGVPIELISKAPDGPLPNGVATDVVMTPDTRYVVFTSSASNLIESDTFNSFDVFVLDRETGTIENVHVTSGGEQGDRDALVLGLAVTPDGRYVAFSSLADNLAPGSLTYQVFLHDRTTDQTELISVSTSGGPGADNPSGFSGSPAISNDGRYVAFWSLASNLVVGDTNNHADVFIRDRQSGTTTRISVGPGGVQGNEDSGVEVDGTIFVSSMQIILSDDARYVCFSSLASNLVAGDNPSVRDVFVHDRQTGLNELISIGFDGSPADDGSMGGWPAWFGASNLAMTPDARYVAFDSLAGNLIADDPNGSGPDIFVRDRQTQTTSRVNISGIDSNALMSAPLLSNDGRFVFFMSSVAGLVPGQGGGGSVFLNRFRYDRQTDDIALINVTESGAAPNDWTVVTAGAVSADGLTVVFGSSGTNHVSGDLDENPQMYLRELASESDEDCNFNLIADACEPAASDPSLFVAELLADQPDPALTCLFDRNDDEALDGLDIAGFLDDLLGGS
ncbi:MAG: hypothetical protein MI923_25450 [Phycisphaerales bacterium]|nr:hypothetical protein [Phycisphaerales bacterium]